MRVRARIWTRNCVWLSMPRSALPTRRRKTRQRPGRNRLGFIPLLCFLDRPEVADGEALSGLLRPGNAGATTAADYMTVLDQALASLPQQARRRHRQRRCISRAYSSTLTAPPVYIRLH